MANYKLNYSGEKIDELLTKIDNLGTGTDTKSGTVKLSSATDSNSGVSDGVAATPKAVKGAYDAVAAVNETVGALSQKVEKNTSSISENKNAVSQLNADMNTKANKSDVLSLEEIQASTDLSGKIASASSLKRVADMTRLYTYVWYGNANNYIKFTPSTFDRRPYFIFGDGNGTPFFGVFYVSVSEVIGFRISSIGTAEITGSVADNVVTVNNATLPWSATGMISENPVSQLH